MPPIRLTALKVKTVKSTAKTQRLFDGGGLYLEVSPRGKKWWRLKYHYAGKEKRISLGVFPQVTLKEARDRRFQAKKLLEKHIDPSEHRQGVIEQIRTDAANTFEVIAREWFELQEPGWAKSYSCKVIQRLEKNIFPWIGRKPIGSITAPQLLQAIRRIEGRGVIETAHRALSTCGQIFRYAIATGRAERGVAADLRGALRPFQRNHFAAVTEPHEVSVLLRKINGYEGSDVVCSALRLAPLVFVRP